MLRTPYGQGLLQLLKIQLATATIPCLYEGYSFNSDLLMAPEGNLSRHLKREPKEGLLR